MNKPLLHLDRLSQADLGKFSVLLSALLTNSQKARLNVSIPDIMVQVGAFDVQNIPQPVGIGTNIIVGQKVRKVTASDIETFKNQIHGGQKIQAIKDARAICGITLKDAKDYIDSLDNRTTQNI